MFALVLRLRMCTCQALNKNCKNISNSFFALFLSLSRDCLHLLTLNFSHIQYSLFGCIEVKLFSVDTCMRSDTIYVDRLACCQNFNIYMAFGGGGGYNDGNDDDGNGGGGIFRTQMIYS